MWRTFGILVIELVICSGMYPVIQRTCRDARAEQAMEEGAYRQHNRPRIAVAVRIGRSSVANE